MVAAHLLMKTRMELYIGPSRLAVNELGSIQPPPKCFYADGILKNVFIC